MHEYSGDPSYNTAGGTLLPVIQWIALVSAAFLVAPWAFRAFVALGDVYFRYVTWVAA